MRPSVRAISSALFSIVLIFAGAAVPAPALGQSAFITTWETTSAEESITIPTNGSGVSDYDFQIDWGDGTTEQITGTDPDPFHFYAQAGTYTVEISGTFPRIYLNALFGGGSEENASKLQSINQWGSIQWESMEAAFSGAKNMTYAAADRPDLSQVTSTQEMFAGASTFNGDISGWDVSNVTDMRLMFRSAESFNRDVGAWNVSNVVDVSQMFQFADRFNGDISGWNVSSATGMWFMFDGATSFNQDIGEWNVSSVTNMERMFRDATSFNQDIGGWNVSNVTNMAAMFSGASEFDQDLGGWDVSNVQSFEGSDSFGGFLQNAELSPANYDALLIGWEQLDLVDDLTFDAGSSQYTSDAADARQSIIDNNNWTINDGGSLPAAPTSLQATAGDGQVSLGWDANTEDGLAGYNVYRSTSSFQEVANATQVNDELVGEASYTDADLTNGTEYFYRVTAVDTSGNESTGSNEVSATPTDQAPPAAPTGLQATAGDGQVDLNWDANSEDDLAGYNVYRSTSSFQETANATQVNDELVGEASYTDADLTNGTEYFYRVTAVDDTGNESSPSNQASAQPTAPPPEAVTEAATSVTATGAQLNGTVDPNGAETTVEFEYFPTGNPDQVQTVAASESPLTGDGDQDVSAEVSGLEPGTEYTFRVLAENSAGSDTGSEQTFATGTSAPTAETGSATGVTATGATLEGTVNPNGAETSVEFEYFPSGQSDQVQTVAASESPLAGSGTQDVSAQVSALEPGTEYTFRVLAENSAGSDTGSEQTFATGTSAPTAETGSATGVTATGATLEGTVDPGGAATDATFRYYRPADSAATAETVVAATGLTGSAEQPVSASLDGLRPATEYAFRLRAENEEGSSAGAVQAFATDAEPPAAEARPVAGVTVTGAELRGRVNPRGAETTVEFEYFPTGNPDQAQTAVATQSPLTGRTAQPVSASVGGLRPDTEYRVRVVATSAGGTGEANTSFATSSLEVTLNQSAEVPEQGRALGVTAEVSEGFSPAEQQLLYRRVGKQEFQSVPLEPAGESTYEETVPESAVTERGLEYFVRFSDGAITATRPEEGAEAPRYVPVQTPRKVADTELDSAQYQMISVPLRLDTTNALAQLHDDFGEIDRTEWRLLRWSPQAEEYEEVTTSENASGSGGGTLVPGQAYWLITRSGQTQGGDQAFDVGPGRSVPAVPIPIELPPGCLQIANPRPYPVAWSSVGGRESVMDPVAYTPSATDSLDFGVEVLDPWAGYWVCNPGESAAQISVPPQEAGVEASQTAEKSQASGETALFGDGSMFDVPPTYALRLAARLERAEAPDLRDVQNVMGVADAGRPGARAEDVAEPPPIGSEYLRLSVVEETPSGRSMQLAGSLRPPSSKGQTWDVKVSASGAEEEPHTVRGRLQARGALPQGSERRLLDRDTGRPIQVGADGAFTLQLTDERPVRHLRLIVGSEGFAEAESESIRPERTGLRAVYPNPSRGPVSVDYHLKKTQRVEVRVFDLLGRTVKTLVSGQREAGHYTARWSATDVASGMYLVRLQTESTSATQRVSVVH